MSSADLQAGGAGLLGRQTFDALADCYLSVLRTVHDAPEFQNAPRGQPSREIVGISFTILNSRERLVVSPRRRANPVFNFAEALWYLRGLEDLDYIAYYAPSIRRFSEDGVTLKGTAYGPRIFRYGVDRIDQWTSVIRTLQADRDSKRAVLQIFSPSELWRTGNLDVACTVALQFLIRGNALEAVSYMRANDAYRGMVSDIFSFTFLQEVMARQLGVELGRYHHHVGSLHIYDADLPRVEEVLGSEDELPSRASLGAFPAMPVSEAWPDIHHVLEIEKLLRTSAWRPRASELDDLPLDQFWKQVLALFEVYREIRHGEPVDPDIVELLCPLFRTAVVYRWPLHFTPLGQQPAIAAVVQE